MASGNKSDESCPDARLLIEEIDSALGKGSGPLIVYMATSRLIGLLPYVEVIDTKCRGLLGRWTKENDPIVRAKINAEIERVVRHGIKVRFTVAAADKLRDDDVCYPENIKGSTHTIQGIDGLSCVATGSL